MLHRLEGHDRVEAVRVLEVECVGHAELDSWIVVARLRVGDRIFGYVNAENTDVRPCGEEWCSIADSASDIEDSTGAQMARRETIALNM